MKLLIQYLAVGGAGFLGAIARVAAGKAVGAWFDTRFPVATLLINVSGSFILGWFLTWTTDRYPVTDTTRLAVGAGFVGAYTTFSTLMYETSALADDAAWLEAVLNLVLSLALGLLAVRLGIVLARRA
jgi:CrcB protein